MSGGQRKRVTFADLVTARLPTAAPQQESDSRPSEDAIANPPTPSTADPENIEDSADALHTTHDADGQDFAEAASQETAIETPSVDDTSLSPGDSQSPDGSQSPAVRRSFRQAGASQNDSQPPHDSQPPDDSQSSTDRLPLKEVRGYLRLANTVIDSLLPTLDVYEQAVYIQLYRLSHGFGNFSCKVSLPTLQSRTGVKPTSLKQAIGRLQARGVVEKLSAEIGFGREQGITYWVSPDGRQTYGDWQSSGGSQSPDDTNKIKAFKENKLKGKLSAEEIKSCPDCQGVGMWYPEGIGRGVARCYHPSLRRQS